MQEYCLLQSIYTCVNYWHSNNCISQSTFSKHQDVLGKDVSRKRTFCLVSMPTKFYKHHVCTWHHCPSKDSTNYLGGEMLAAFSKYTKCVGSVLLFAESWNQIKTTALWIPLTWIFPFLGMEHIIIGWLYPDLFFFSQKQRWTIKKDEQNTITVIYVSYRISQYINMKI